MSVNVDAVLTPAKRARRGWLTGVIGIAHLAISVALVLLIRQSGAGASGDAEQPLLDVVLGAVFHVLTIPVLAVRILIAPLIRHTAIDAALLAINSVIYAVVVTKLVRWFGARRRR